MLQVGRIEEPLSPPRNPSDVAKIAFEISRRHRFFRELDDVTDGVTVHVLPAGGPVAGDEKLGSFRRLDATKRRIEQSYAATSAYLERS